MLREIFKIASDESVLPERRLGMIAMLSRDTLDPRKAVERMRLARVRWEAERDK